MLCHGVHGRIAGGRLASGCLKGYWAHCCSEVYLDGIGKLVIGQRELGIRRVREEERSWDRTISCMEKCSPHPLGLWVDISLSFCHVGQISGQEHVSFESVHFAADLALEAGEMPKSNILGLRDRRGWNTLGDKSVSDIREPKRVRQGGEGLAWDARQLGHPLTDQGEGPNKGSVADGSERLKSQSTLNHREQSPAFHGSTIGRVHVRLGLSQEGEDVIECAAVICDGGGQSMAGRDRPDQVGQFRG